MKFRKILLLFAVTIILILACREKKVKESNSSWITRASQQDSIFNDIISLTNPMIPEEKQNDSLVFLIIRMEATCPSCLKKSVDSISKHKNDMDDKHFIVLSATNKKIIESYFTDQNYEFPNVVNKIFIDSTDESYTKDLVVTKPTIYYSHNKKVYRKVTCVPNNIKKELRLFFQKKMMYDLPIAIN